MKSSEPHLFDGRVEGAELAKGELGFDGLEGVGVCAESEIAPGDGLRTKARDKIGDGEGSELTKGANAPECECFSVIGGEIEDAEWEFGERSGLLAVWDDGDSARGGGLEACGVEVAAYGNRRAQACGGERGAQALGQCFGRAKEALGAGDVENAGGGIGQTEELDARRELGGAFEQDSARGGFGLSRALEEAEVDDGFGFKAGHAERSAFEMGVVVERAEDLHGRAAVENGDGQGFEFGAQAEQTLGGEFSSVDAGVEMGFHADSLFETLAHEALADHVDRGGLRAETLLEGASVRASVGEGTSERAGVWAKAWTEL
jgi:hypothetical protein